MLVAHWGATLLRAAVVVALLLAGCGTSAAPSGRPTATPAARSTVTVGEIERRNAKRAKPTPTPARRPRVERPRIVRALIPFPDSRKREMAAYAERHYGLDSYELRDPKVIVEHYTVTDDAAGAIAIFRPDVADAELHELPGVCSHYVIDRDGTIYQLVPLSIMCRHTVGLNSTAIGIEHAGFKASEILGDDAQMKASLALTRWLQCRYGIDDANVIGHNESLSSPYHRERVAALRTQTHQDWTASEMAVYRRRLTRLPTC